MPIIDPVNEALPLSQGDILRDVTLYSTECTLEDGPRSKASKARLCLVLSRPCVVGHKAAITVAEIQKYSMDLPRDVSTFDDMLDFLTAIRDGSESPDVFYLGHLLGEEGRFCARLELIHTLHVPTDESPHEFVSRHRVATLNTDFCRDLHLRIFRAYASLGFDDLRWLSDEDLNTLVTHGKSDIARALAEVAQHKATEAQQEMRGQQHKGKALAAAEQAVNSLQQRIQPYLDEAARRNV